MPLASKDQLLGARALPYVDVACSELGADVTMRVRCLTALEKDRYETGFFFNADGSQRDKAAKTSDARARLLVLACINDDGSPFFASVDEAGCIRVDVADKLYQVACKLSVLDAEDVKELQQAFAQARIARSSTT